MLEIAPILEVFDIINDFLSKEASFYWFCKPESLFNMLYWWNDISCFYYFVWFLNILNYIISPFLFSFLSRHFPALPGSFRFMALVPLMAVNTIFFASQNYNYWLKYGTCSLLSNSFEHLLAMLSSPTRTWVKTQLQKQLLSQNVSKLGGTISVRMVKVMMG